ncbi:MAG: transketolase [Clostridia bacterium]|nr:transketolase [Clostridia bacterium]
MNTTDKKALMKLAANVRMDILTEVYSANSGHPGGSLSIADVLSYLYKCVLRVDPSDPDDPDRDRFVLSKGHTAPALYAILAESGFIPKEDLKTFRRIDSYLQGHPDMKHTPGCDMTSGSLGLGLSAAAGMALGAKRQKKGFKVYVVCGDGEIAEGQIWEAAMFSAHYKLDNLCVFIDWNGLQIDGRIVDVMNSTPIDEKFAAFGWHVQVINGHDFDEIEQAVDEASHIVGVPSVIIMKTVKGKGVSYMENQASWHGAAPNEEQYKQGMAELEAALAEIDS